MLVRQLELALGQDHALRGGATQLRALERAPVRHAEPRRGHRDGVSGAEVPGAAHDLARRVVTRVHLAELQPVGIRMGPRLDDESGDHQPLETVLLGQAATRDLLDLDAGERDLPPELGERRQRILQVGLEPLEQDLHRRPPANCSRKRRSSS